MNGHEIVSSRLIDLLKRIEAVADIDFTIFDQAAFALSHFQKSNCFDGMIMTSYLDGLPKLKAQVENCLPDVLGVTPNRFGRIKAVMAISDWRDRKDLIGELCTCLIKLHDLTDFSDIE